ncbi:vacuolar protein-sorting-associated protein 39 [Ceratobasidium sp. AG-Ba]|nr:vacuolar protein-sorting-associated protein 39 [Ceratobasidium sp. AG-Ba]QRW05703.1 vacuolar protein-sorting-associated protein 39 [Ceratobasidium sp. AG-Ba]
MSKGREAPAPSPVASSPLDIFARVSNSAIGKAPAKPPPPVQVVVRCVQALGRDIYVGNSDGTLLRYSLREQGSSRDEDSYHVTARQVLASRKPIDQIALVPSVAKLLVFSAGTIHFYMLPTLDPIPQALIQSMTRTLMFAVDEQAMRLPFNQGPFDAKVEPVGFCVFTRSQMRLFTLRERLFHLKDVPLAPPPPMARRWGAVMCTTDSENYNILGLDNFSMLPVMPLPSLTTPGTRPRIVSSGDGGFVVLQASGDGGIAVFLTPSGDPDGALIEMPYFPIDIALDPPYLIALLPNNTIEIHNYTLQPPAIVQVISRPEGFSPHSLVTSHYSYAVATTPPGLTPPPTPTPAKDQTPTTYARARTVLVSNDAIQSLVPATLLSQAESLLSAGRTKDVLRLLESVKKKGGDEDQDMQVRYIYTQIAYSQLAQSEFEEAGNNFFRAETDARALIRLFPDLCDGLLEFSRQEETMPVFRGLEDVVRNAGGIEETVRNYSPELGENEKPLPELHAQLMASAREMIRAFLHKTRNRRRYGGASHGKKDTEGDQVWKAVDIALARLFAEAGETSELLDLIESSTLLTVRAVDSALVEHRQFQALVVLCTKLRDEARLVEVLTKLHDRQYVDAGPGIRDAFQRILKILGESHDPELVRKYGIWVVRHDSAAGLKIFTSRTNLKLDDAAVLKDMQDADPSTASKFLEHLVLHRRNMDSGLHNQLVTGYVEDVILALQEPAVRDHFSELVKQYKSASPTPFLLYLASGDDFPNVVDARVRLALFLQGSNSYNARAVRKQLEECEFRDILAYERAIVDGKAGHHRKALTNLVHEVHDSISAEAYCALGGAVVPAKVATSVGARRGLQPLARLVGTGGKSIVPVTEEKRRELLKTLMEVYTAGGEATADQTARLLNSQARNFDAIQVLEATPDSWSLSVISSFLERSLRRTMHDSREGMILKHLSAGQNLATVDTAMQIAKEEGYVVEEADEDADGDADGDFGNEKSDYPPVVEPVGPSSFEVGGLQGKKEWNEDDLGIS